MILLDTFFDRDPVRVAQMLIGKVIRRRYRRRWLSAAIVEAEAYLLEEKGSHASLGRTPSREALFMRAGTIYMYYARGGDSLNVSCRGDGNAVLIKSGVPVVDEISPAASLAAMHDLNPGASGPRPTHRLCSGQTLLCRALDLKVPAWNCKSFDPRTLFVDDVGYRPPALIQARRLGIPAGRDEHLRLRFVDRARVRSATQNPLTRRTGPHDHRILEWSKGRWTTTKIDEPG